MTYAKPAMVAVQSAPPLKEVVQTAPAPATGSSAVGLKFSFRILDLSLWALMLPIGAPRHPNMVRNLANFQNEFFRVRVFVWLAGANLQTTGAN
jgi:hypothetical protein